MAKNKSKQTTRTVAVRRVPRFTEAELRDRSFMGLRAVTEPCGRSEQQRLECRGTKAGRRRDGGQDGW